MTNAYYLNKPLKSTGRKAKIEVYYYYSNITRTITRILYKALVRNNVYYAKVNGEYMPLGITNKKGTYRAIVWK